MIKPNLKFYTLKLYNETVFHSIRDHKLPLYWAWSFYLFSSTVLQINSALYPILSSLFCCPSSAWASSTAIYLFLRLFYIWPDSFAGIFKLNFVSIFFKVPCFDQKLSFKLKFSTWNNLYCPTEKCRILVLESVSYW